MFTIFIMHTSFQLWHAKFPASYLRGLRYPTDPTPAPAPAPAPTPTPAPAPAPAAPEVRITLRCSRAYDFANVPERAAWLDVLVALVRYLQSGESRVGYLSRALRRNRLHKRVDEEVESELVAEGSQAQNVQARNVQTRSVEDSEDSKTETVVEKEPAEVEPRRLLRKRRLETVATAGVAAVADDEATTQTASKSQRRRRQRR